MTGLHMLINECVITFAVSRCRSPLGQSDHFSVIIALMYKKQFTSFFQRMAIFVTTKLRSSRHWQWYIVGLAIVLSEMVTLAMNSLNSMLWWGRIDTDLLLIGAIDALVASFFVAAIAVFLIRHAFNLEDINRKLQEQMEERIRMENERFVLEEKLQQSKKMESLGILAGGVAHDLNNILGAVVGYPDLLVAQMPAGSPFIEPLLTVKRSGERAATVVQDLLSLARRGVVATTVFNPNEMIRDCLQSLEFSRLKDVHPHVDLKTNLAMDVHNIRGSVAHLAKALMNLMTNAFEAVNASGLVALSTENIRLDTVLDAYETIHPGDYACINVCDTGDGIPEDYLRKIFEPFFTRKAMGRSGSGLGLAVVWGTVKDHEGFIDVKSRPREGTCFRIFFPATSEQIQAIDKVDSIDESKGRGETILVVDDVEEQRELAVQILTHLGYIVHTAQSGLDALDFLYASKADLVLLDMIMEPGMDGLDTYRRIRQMHPHQKAVIASGFSQSHRVKEAMILGANAYLQKPYLPVSLARTVREALDGG
jgi:two-component system, cell cycle sensor histidine kinase and response regulator CckA